MGIRKNIGKVKEKDMEGRQERGKTRGKEQREWRASKEEGGRERTGGWGVQGKATPRPTRARQYPRSRQRQNCRYPKDVVSPDKTCL